jgi:hypothetical protein
MSSYAKGDKSPYQYSSEYQRWRAAVRSNDDRAAREADIAHRRRFSPHTLLITRNGAEVKPLREVQP